MRLVGAAKALIAGVYPTAGVIEYSDAVDVREMASSIVKTLDLSYIDLGGVLFVRSSGSRSRLTVARIHSLSRVWRQALGTGVTYIVEVIGEKYDGLSEEEKEKTIIHELLHIPRAFGGGFRSHRSHANRRSVERLHESYIQAKRAR